MSLQLATSIAVALTSWNDIVLGLKIYTCGLLPPIENGGYEYKSNTEGMFVDIYCNTGYLLMGENRRRCLKNGWAGTNPSCTIRTCPVLPNILSGTVLYSSRNREFGSQVTYSCYVGHTLQGNPQRSCNDQGSWTGREPSCSVKICPVLPTILSGSIIYSRRREFGSSATYLCKAGYSLEGDPQRRCAVDGDWTGTEPHCQIRVCPSLPAISFGSIVYLRNREFGSDAIYSCDPGYTLEGPKERKCSAEGGWTGVEPRCQIKTCPVLSSISMGSIIYSPNRELGSYAIYSCSPGYSLKGDEMRSCNTEGSWTGAEPHCQSTTCPVLPSIPSGNIVYSREMELGSNATYSCQPGYTLNGDTMRSCNDDGSWTGMEPHCQIVECDSLMPLENGIITYSQGLKYGSVASLQCNESYYLSNNIKERVCMASGYWSEEQDTCTREQCPAVTDFTNGHTAYLNSREVYSYLVHECYPGYELIGNMKRVCELNKTWTGLTPICNAKQCLKLPDITNGSVEQPMISYANTTAKYSCEPGFGLIGNSQRTCTAEGTWSGSRPSCMPTHQPAVTTDTERKSCGPPPELRNGKVEVSTTKKGIMATYSCLPQFVLKGSHTRTCNSNGFWSLEAQACSDQEKTKLHSLLYVMPVTLYYFYLFKNL